MPRYQYRCTKCDTILTVFHLSDEVQTDCTHCKATGHLVKLLTTFSTKKNQKEKKKVGDVTEEFIKEAQQDLKKQKKDLEKAR